MLISLLSHRLSVAVILGLLNFWVTEPLLGLVLALLASYIVWKQFRERERRRYYRQRERERREYWGWD